MHGQKQTWVLVRKRAHYLRIHRRPFGGAQASSVQHEARSPGRDQTKRLTHFHLMSSKALPVLGCILYRLWEHTHIAHRACVDPRGVRGCSLRKHTRARTVIRVTSGAVLPLSLLFATGRHQVSSKNATLRTMYGGHGTRLLFTQVSKGALQFR